MNMDSGAFEEDPRLEGQLNFEVGGIAWVERGI